MQPHQLDLTTFTLSLYDKERLKDDSLRIILADKQPNLEKVYNHIRFVAGLLSEINNSETKSPS